MEGLFTSGSVRHTGPQFLPTGVHESHPVFFPLQAPSSDPPDPDLEMGGGEGGWGGGGRYQYCYEGRNVNQQGDVETRNKTITFASFLFIFSIIIFCKVFFIPHTNTNRCTALHSILYVMVSLSWVESPFSHRP